MFRNLNKKIRLACKFISEEVKRGYKQRNAKDLGVVEENIKDEQLEGMFSAFMIKYSVLLGKLSRRLWKKGKGKGMLGDGWDWRNVFEKVRDKRERNIYRV